eukprot:CAMPEP_0170510588 /NCGR_PEP_ID=MMETSP0208-20121228/65848_1 /TAXON_ID=197538 /ORGANISM="Strombidium inclinatum, Strain S3" /LENGTH=174 /DNA_ID=CAMNT_0010794067 /DNA_START=337 /DNA_END=861 /DNA_ORIENTATION=+
MIHSQRAAAVEAASRVTGVAGGVGGAEVTEDVAVIGTGPAAEERSKKLVACSKNTLASLGDPGGVAGNLSEIVTEGASELLGNIRFVKKPCASTEARYPTRSSLALASSFALRTCASPVPSPAWKSLLVKSYAMLQVWRSLDVSSILLACSLQTGHSGFQWALHGSWQTQSGRS